MNWDIQCIPLTRSKQPYQYGEYTIFVAEVASTLNEGLLTQYLLKNTEDRATRISLLNHSAKVSVGRSTARPCSRSLSKILQPSGTG